jgi:hypothetical protein
MGQPIAVPPHPKLDDTDGRRFSVDPKPGEHVAMSEKRVEGLAELANTIEALVNLLYLIRIDRHDPEKVLQWVDMAEGQAKRMGSILQMKWPPIPSASEIENQS